MKKYGILLLLLLVTAVLTDAAAQAETMKFPGASAAIKWINNNRKI